MKGPTHWVRLQNGSTPECLFSKFSTSPTQFLLNTTQKYSSCILGSRLAYTGTKMMSMIANKLGSVKIKHLSCFGRQQAKSNKYRI